MILEKIKNFGVLKQGYFTYDIIYDGHADKKTVSNIKWVDDPTGPIKIFKDVEKGVPYVLGGDTAGEGSDANTATVIDNSNDKIVATLHQKQDETTYTLQVYCLGKYFNDALVGLETNYSTYPTKMLSEE